MIDSLSGGLGDLPADLIGSRQQAYLKFPNETSIIQEETDLDRVLSSMSKTPHMACIPNTEYRIGVPSGSWPWRARGCRGSDRRTPSARQEHPNPHQESGEAWPRVPLVALVLREQIRACGDK